MAQFLRVLSTRSPQLTWLVSPHFGNRLSKDSPIRVAALKQAPQLEVRNLAQVPALPLGSRIKMDPWDDHVEMSLEVTPIYPNLVSFKPGEKQEIAAKPSN